MTSFKMASKILKIVVPLPVLLTFSYIHKSGVCQDWLKLQYFAIRRQFREPETCHIATYFLHTVYSITTLCSWWRHQMETFPALLAFVQGIHRSPVNSPPKGQWRGALKFSLICVWINGWVNNREAGNWRRYRTHYDVTVMWKWRRGVGVDCICIISLGSHLAKVNTHMWRPMLLQSGIVIKQPI